MIPGLKKRVFNFHDLLMYVALVRKHLRLMALLIVLCLMAGMVYYIYAKPVFYSRSLVRVDSLALPLDTDKIFHDSNIATVVLQLQAPHIIERTAHALGVDADYRKINKEYLKKISIRQNAEKNLE